MGFIKIVLVSSLLAVGSSALAHSYISSPPSRAYLCKLGENNNCGPVQYEPQTVEGYSKFPAQGPADGQIASGGLAHNIRPDFAPLDEQTSSRWTKQNMQAGQHNFTWTLTAAHVARNWRYYITKADWNPNQKLSRASFDTTPFCVIDGGMRLPPLQVTHSCNIPARSGYQVILGVWEVGDTDFSFYSVIDVMFAGTGTPPPPATWTQRGQIIPSVDLKLNDVAETRVFDANGERPDLKTRLVIPSDADGQHDRWSFLLASRINTEQRFLQAGQAGADGKFNPVPGTNAIFAKNDSGISRVEIQVTKAAAPITADIIVSGVASNYTISNGQINIGVNVTTLGDQDVSVYLYDSKGATKGFTTASLNNTTKLMQITALNPAVGQYQLVVKGAVKSTGQVLQKTANLTVSGTQAYDYVFPNNLASYRAGTRVLQPKTGAIYQCKPYPYSGYCVQWNPTSVNFEPGIGSNWRDAWIAQ